MSKCEDSNPIGHFQINNVKWESSYGHFPCRQVLRYERNRRSGVGKTPDEFESRIDGFQEFTAKSFTLSLVPCGSLGEFGRRFRFSPKRLHFLKLRVMRSRTSSQGSPADSPDRTRRARRSISIAQAASTSAGFPAGSSRLANNSAAKSARSSGESVRASRSNSWARLLMTAL